MAVFARAPRPGEAKTRLIPVLGEAGAARLHAALVERAVHTAARAGLGPVQLWCAPDAGDPFFARVARQHGASLHAQPPGDLGARMQAAFTASLTAGRRLVLVGSDCPALEPRHLRLAAAALDSHDAAFVPAEDGGYALVALSRPVPEIFVDIDWGTAGVMQATRTRLRAFGARWAELQALWDVDRPEDYRRLVEAALMPLP